MCTIARIMGIFSRAEHGRAVVSTIRALLAAGLGGCQPMAYWHLCRSCAGTLGGRAPGAQLQPDTWKDSEYSRPIALHRLRERLYFGQSGETRSPWGHSARGWGEARKDPIYPQLYVVVVADDDSIRSPQQPCQHYFVFLGSIHGRCCGRGTEPSVGRCQLAHRSVIFDTNIRTSLLEETGDSNTRQRECRHPIAKAAQHRTFVRISATERVYNPFPLPVEICRRCK